MNKNLFTLLLMLSGSLLFAQYPVYTIQQIQTRTPVQLAACNDTSAYEGDTVIVRGVVVTAGDSSTAASGRNVWIKDGNGAWHGLDVFAISSSTATTPDDLKDLVEGDSVEIVGRIDEYLGESEIRPISVTIVGSKPAPTPTLVTIAALNDNTQTNILTTGEQWEGVYVELQNVTVTAVSYFSGGTRVSFTVEDASGNKLNVSDRFICARMPIGTPAGPFVPPTVGDVYTSLKGILAHSKNGCSGFSGRGYELYPFKTSHYVKGAAAPSIYNIVRSPITPNSSTAPTISATITDADGIASATLYYAVGIGTVTYTAVPMTNTSGSTWSANIPAQADGSFVKYYISATDMYSSPMTSNMPNVPGSSNPLFYFVRDAGTQIYDLQFTPYTDGNSGYRDLTVTVTGVVTASSADLGYVFIQQESIIDWAGIMCVGSASLATLTLGQKVTVTGEVKENYSFTRLENITSVAVVGTGSISPVTLAPATFTTYDFATNEMYEGMLVNITAPNLQVVDQNCDDPSNFGEYRIGTDTLDPATGTRVLAGRQTSSTFSSLNVSYVNDAMWATTDGIMAVPAIVVTVGTQVDTVRGIIAYTFGNMKLLPRNNSDFINLVTGVETVTPTSVVNVYPNPAQDMMYVINEVGADMLEIVDGLGRLVRTTALTAGRNEIGLENCSTGMYIVRMLDSNGGLVGAGRVSVIR